MRLALAAAATCALALAASGTAGTSYCSPTGDYCTSVARVHGLRYLRMSTFSFGGHVKICVRDPTAARICRRFVLRKLGQLWQVKVLWKRHYPNAGAGRYRVTFFFGATRLGPVLSFRQP
ncbi:MAG TPA: hypothetical protein VI142_11290 [Gaiellaceae bacterium]